MPQGSDTPSEDDPEYNFNMMAHTMLTPSSIQRSPYKMATYFPHDRDSEGRVAYTHFTYEQLNEEIDRFAHGMVESGIQPGSRVLLLVPPSLDFVALFAALLKVGAIPLLIDPGMGVFRMVSCIEMVSPDAFIGISMAHVARILFPKSFRSVKLSVTVGKRWFWGGPVLSDLRSENREPYPIFKAKKDDTAGIFFTTGSTGPPKGVVYTHGMFDSMMGTYREQFQLDESSIDMPAFPPFALFNIAVGGTSVIPDMDPTKPAEVDPVKLVEAINNFGVTFTYGSPAIWRRLSEYCEENDITLPSMRRILMFGAPIPGHILESFRKILPNGDAYTPYGATEALLVTSISGTEICEETLTLSLEGKGTCVGYVIPGIELKIIEITDDEITLSDGGIDALCLPQGTVGEITVRGDYVTKEYYALPEKTAKAKIKDGDTVWHRMGDLGYLDKKNRLWFVGRKAHRIKRDGVEHYPVMVEAHFNQIEGVFRSAMVGVSCPKLGQRMVIVIEPVKGNMPRGSRQQKERSEFFISHAREKDLPVDAVLFHPSFPVDIRHNAKIKREELTLWAEKQLKGRFDS